MGQYCIGMSSKMGKSGNFRVHISKVNNMTRNFILFWNLHGVQRTTGNFHHMEQNSLFGLRNMRISIMGKSEKQLQNREVRKLQSPDLCIEKFTENFILFLISITWVAKKPNFYHMQKNSRSFKTGKSAPEWESPKKNFKSPDLYLCSRKNDTKLYTF